MNVLSLNPGSSSLKFGLFGKSAIYRGNVDRDQAIAKLVGEVRTHGAIDAVACRVVHGASRFTEPTLIDDAVLTEIEALAPLAPLHNAADVAVLRAVGKALPGIPVYAVFDTAFHRTIPAVAFTYALPVEFAVRRYGFHGISYRHVSEALRHVRRLIVCHLGNGASVCAIQDGSSIDTSMGMTPLEGLVMGTRSGDVDPGVLTYLLRRGDLTAGRLDDLLNHESGLLGISGQSGDVRELLASEDERARLALEVFAYRVAKYVGAYTAALGGIDGLAFTGGIGERSPEMRAMICRRLAYLNIHLSEEVPATGLHSISLPNSLPVWVVPADEELQMAKEVRDFVESPSN